GGYILENEISRESIAELEKRLRHISGAIKHNGRKILTNYPITSPQFVALQWLIEEGDLTIAELSHKNGLAFSTTTDRVDRMEKNDLVKRIKDDNDRRVVLIQVLEKGQKSIKEVIHRRQDLVVEDIVIFSNEQVDVLRELLELLHKQMKITNEK